MKHIIRYGLFAAACAVLAACSTAQTDRFIEGVKNFARGISAVDDALKDVNATLYSNCSNIVDVAGAINDIAGQCSKAAPYTSTANAVIDKYCQASQLSTNGGIAASIKVTAASYNAAKATLAQNKQVCSGG
ncbi:MAG: hypothetical protein JSS57_07435 [Proteobacteria bacterium]|nr:hypothetical protein [Pseudomonadota bacterium]